MRSVLEAGFIFWGLFGVFALIVALYLAWMWWVERRGPVSDPAGADETGAGAGGPDAEPGGRGAP